MAQARALNATQVNALTKEGVHWVAPSLYMQVRDHGTRSWLFRYSRNGTSQWMGLGSTEDKPLSDARRDAPVKVKRGEDPIARSGPSARSR